MLECSSESMPHYLGLSRTGQKHMSFGSEYAAHSKWSATESCYIRRLGVLDLPSRLRARTILKELTKLPGNTYLDIGTGTGNYSFYLSRDHSNKVWGIDVDAQRIRECNRIVASLGRDNAHFCVGSGDVGLKIFETESFDVVLAVEVLQYVPSISVALREAYRVLKPGGYLVGHVPSLGSLRPTERNLFNDQNIPNLLRDAGFEIVSLISTFGGNIRRLCRLFEWASHRRIVVAMIFPIVLAVSRLFSIQSSDGDYRLFVARKPLT
jgi:SAM-dependent methyltransferase